MYDEIRTALGRGFYLDNLWQIVRLSFAIVHSGQAKHPAVPFAIATIVEKIANRWAGHALPDDTAAVVEAHVQPKLVALLDVADADPSTVAAALDDAARAYAEAIPIIDAVI